jgi:hypothetical protein
LTRLWHVITWRNTLAYQQANILDLGWPIQASFKQRPIPGRGVLNLRLILDEYIKTVIVGKWIKYKGLEPALQYAYHHLTAISNTIPIKNKFFSIYQPQHTKMQLKATLSTLLLGSIAVVVSAFGYDYDGTYMLQARAPEEHAFHARGELLEARNEYLAARDFCMLIPLF